MMSSNELGGLSSMFKKERVRAMQADIMRAEGALLVTPVSELSLDGLLRMGADVHGAWTERPERAVVFDFRSARFALTPRRWEQSFRAAARWHYRPGMAMAVVVDDVDLDFFDSRAPLFAQHGVVQTVFTSLPDALAWARTRRASPPPPRRAARR